MPCGSMTFKVLVHGLVLGMSTHCMERQVGSTPSVPQVVLSTILSPTVVMTRVPPPPVPVP